MEGTFPDRLTYSKAKPVFKKADNCCVSNYSPVLPLTDFSEISNKRVYQFLNSQRVPFKENNFNLEKVYQQTYTPSMMKSCALKNKMSSCSVTLPQHLIV
jgi:hypothetical protein